MKILITGANGQVGHCLTSQLQSHADIEVLALDVKGLDITDQKAVFSQVKTFKPNLIINAAAHTAVDKAETESESAYAINGQGTENLAFAAEEVGAAIFHISTDYVFDGNKSGMYDETDLANPKGVYGASKLAGEMALQKANKNHIILRTAWVFGEHGNNFVKTMLRLGKERDALSIVGDQYGGPTYAGDIANTLIELALKLKKEGTLEYGVYHYSGLPHVSWFEFAQYIFEQAENKGVCNQPKLTSITTQDYPTPAKRPSNSKLSTQKITDTFAIKASDWKAALENIEAYNP